MPDRPAAPETPESTASPVDTTGRTAAAEISNNLANAAVEVGDLIKQLHISRFRHEHPSIKNANKVHKEGLSCLDRAAMAVTDKVGSVGFFLVILVWTVVWCGYNILASEVPALGWHAFDPFPAFVAYLLISNVLQILLMPMIMVGQNLQGRHSEIRAELDFEINQKAEQEVVAILQHLEQNTELLLALVRHMQCPVPKDLISAAQGSEA